ncbi:MAG: hypothetical protein HY906_21980 [Deltaproteobacteria bacterium]|nr:hypothetical protein [Deltaproteobacteria bacterium]
MGRLLRRQRALLALPLLAVAAWLCASCGGRDAAHRGVARDAAAPRDAGAARATWIEASDGGVPRYVVFPGAGPALAHVLQDKPRVVGFGEYHQRVGGPTVPSAIKRFTEQMLPVLATQATDLVVETWVTDGSCGVTEKKVVANVKKTTARPKATENEIVTLALKARAARVQPHALKVGCADYQKMLGGKNVDYVKLLEFIGRQLRDTAVAAMAQRDRPPATARGGGPDAGVVAGSSPDGGAPAGGAPDRRRLVALYGGALHNDLYPAAGLEAWSFAADLAKHGRYVEVDLYVPEYVAGDERLAKEPWFPLLRRAGPDRVLVVERDKDSYIFVLSTTPLPASAPAATGGAGPSREVPR